MLIMFIIVIVVNTHISNVIDEDYYKNAKPSFSTVEECIDEEINYYEHAFGDDYKIPHHDCAKMLFIDEFNNQIALFFQSTDLTVWFYVLEKSVNNDEIEYKLIHSESVFLYYEDWQEYGNFKFSCSKKHPNAALNENNVVNVILEDDIYYITVLHK